MSNFTLNPNLNIMYHTITQIESKGEYLYFEVSTPESLMGVRAVMLGEVGQSRTVKTV